MVAITSLGSPWEAIINKAFYGNRKIKKGKPTVVVAAGVPNVAALVGTLCWDETNSDAYICTVASGTWVKINA